MKLAFIFLFAFSFTCVSAQVNFDTAFAKYEPDKDDLAALDSAYIANHGNVMKDTLLRYVSIYQIENVKFELHKLEYKQKANNYRRAVFNWQLISSVVIFIMVLVIVGAGLFFSAKQFDFTIKMWERKAAANNGARTVASESIDPVPAFDSTVKVTSSSMEVSSPVLGVTILTLSIVFFFLYLRYVYPIGVISDRNDRIPESAQVGGTDE